MGLFFDSFSSFGSFGHQKRQTMWPKMWSHIFIHVLKIIPRTQIHFFVTFIAPIRKYLFEEKKYQANSFRRKRHKNVHARIIKGHHRHGYRCRHYITLALYTLNVYGCSQLNTKFFLFCIELNATHKMKSVLRTTQKQYLMTKV